MAHRLLAALAFGAMAVGLWLAFSTREVAFASDRWGFRWHPALLALSFTVVGYVVADRRPRNPIGWLLLAAGVAPGVQLLSQEYGIYDANAQRLPLAELVAWIDGWIWIPEVAITLCIIPALFPDGRPVTARWRPLLWISSALTIIATLLFAFGPATMASTGLANPLGFGGLAPQSLVIFLPLIALAACGVVAVASLGVRFRRASPDERQQLKWLAFAASLVAVAFLPNALVPQSDQPKILHLLLIVAFALVPIAIGIAVLRYRLYEIDTLINRTLVYGALTALIAGLFVAAQALFQRLFVAATGASSDLAVVLALFLIGTVIAPLKTKLQQTIDARFRPNGAPAPGLQAETATLVTRQLRELAQLRAEGIVSEDEFSAKKKELLARI